MIALIEKIGDVAHKPNNEFEFRVSGEIHFMRKPHKKDIAAPDVVKLRKFLAHAGWSAEARPIAVKDVDPYTPNLMVVVDHHEAKIYDIAADAAHAPAHLSSRTIHIISFII